VVISAAECESYVQPTHAKLGANNDVTAAPVLLASNAASAAAKRIAFLRITYPDGMIERR
jgi:hypothetical protein